jgi:hypothetical protein
VQRFNACCACTDRDKEQAKQHLQALMKDPFTYRARRRSQRRKSSGPDEER